VGVCREVAFSKFSAFQEYINHVCAAEVGGHITGKLTPTLGVNMKKYLIAILSLSSLILLQCAGTFTNSMLFTPYYEINTQDKLDLEINRIEQILQDLGFKTYDKQNYKFKAIYLKEDSSSKIFVIIIDTHKPYEFIVKLHQATKNKREFDKFDYIKDKLETIGKLKEIEEIY
jgi:hypothetical protein